MTVQFKSFTAAAAAVALCVSPTMASAATSTSIQPVSPLVAISVFGTQASAQAVCTGAAGAATAAGAAAAQAQPNCVLPATDAAAPPPVSEVAPLPPPADFGIPPILLALAGLALAGGIIAALSDSDDGDDRDIGISPV
jgi:hypothetical protein